MEEANNLEGNLEVLINQYARARCRHKASDKQVQFLKHILKKILTEEKFEHMLSCLQKIYNEFDRAYLNEEDFDNKSVYLSSDEFEKFWHEGNEIKND